MFQKCLNFFQRRFIELIRRTYFITSSIFLHGLNYLFEEHDQHKLTDKKRVMLHRIASI
jgi:hypothetical protein